MTDTISIDLEHRRVYGQLTFVYLYTNVNPFVNRYDFYYGNVTYLDHDHPFFVILLNFHDIHNVTLKAVQIWNQDISRDTISFSQICNRSGTDIARFL